MSSMTPFVSKERDHDAVSDSCLNQLVHLTAIDRNAITCFGPSTPNLSITILIRVQNKCLQGGFTLSIVLIVG